MDQSGGQTTSVAKTICAGGKCSVSFKIFQAIPLYLETRENKAGRCTRKKKNASLYYKICRHINSYWI